MGSGADDHVRSVDPLLTMGFERREASWLSFAEAKTRVLLASLDLLLPVERRDCPDALGMALAEDIRSPLTLPPWDNSAMDGYAVRAADVRGATPDRPVTLTVTGAVRPGNRPEGSVEKGQAVRIMTGGIVPAGADSVVRVEDTDAEETTGRVEVRDDRDCGRNIRPKGEDLEEGENALEKGTTIAPAQIGLLTALGIRNIPVHRRPLVAILSNGDELVRPGEPLIREDGAVVDSNGPALAAAVQAAGGIVASAEIVPDDRQRIRERLAAAAGAADLIVTSGGASMGEADLFKRVLDELSFELDFWRVRLRPGSPLSFGFLPIESHRDGKERKIPVFGLPGNPVSAFVTFELFVRPFLLSLSGHRRIERPILRGKAASRLSASPGQTVFLRIRIVDEGDGSVSVSPTGPQGSGMLSSIGRAEGLAIVPEGVAAIERGEEVDVILLGDGPGWPAAWAGGIEPLTTGARASE